MPDIAMCRATGTECPREATCYRKQATPSEYLQSYFLKPPVKADGTCDYFWEDRK